MLCDASEKAYSSVVYLRASLHNQIYVAFVIGKSKVCPLKPTSIPRLELQAALLGSRLLKYVCSELEFEIDRVTCWTDSKTVLSWINTEDIRKYKPFVAHRLSEVKENTEIHWWRWVPTNENVADDATKDNISRDNLVNRWLKGPDFLLRGEEFWPASSPSRQSQELPKEEIRKEFLLIATNTEVKENEPFLPNIQRFSSWMRLIRSTAWIVHLAYKFKKKCEIYHNLSVDEIEQAEIMWVSEEQKQHFHEEIEYLNNGQIVPRTSRLYKLSPKLDDNAILRSHGRIQLAPSSVSEDTKNPIILDGDNRFTSLLVQYVHNKVGHLGIEYTCNSIREKYWIIKIRSVVKKALANCQYCKVKKAKPENPTMSLLPEARMGVYQRPFTYVGIDFFGPMQVTVRRSTEKRYGVIFTCLSVRAVHIEIAASLDTNSCIMAIRRMAARRGNPKQIFSDNGTNLKSAEKELKQAVLNIDDNVLLKELAARHVKWTFIPPGSPHMGGAWERLVRSIKNSLYAVLKERKPKEEVLHTLIVECENTVNNRPLTHVSVDIKDDTCLTPNHFLLGCGNILTCPGKFNWKNINLKKSWQVSQALIESFWHRWVREYLPTLVQKTKWYQDQGNNLKVGDIVVICDENLPRNLWPMGKIIEVFKGRDGKVRVVEVRTKTGIFKRPTVKICKLVESSDVEK